MDEERARPRRGRVLLTVLAVAAAVAAVPAGVALAGSGGSEQSTVQQGEAPDRGAPEGRDGDRRDCPKDREGDQPGSGEEGSSFPGYGPPDTTEL
jgi:hypothetical protein